MSTEFLNNARARGQMKSNLWILWSSDYARPAVISKSKQAISVVQENGCAC